MRSSNSGNLGEDILQAMKDMGGKGSLNEIYDQVALIRKEPMPPTWKSSIRERIEAHSRDSKNFQGKHYFIKLDKGIWALSDFNFPNVPGQIDEKENQNLIMEINSTIAENGLFTGKELLKFSLEDSLESISILFQTIKEYREYADKDNAAAWFEYIHDIFSILGLNTIKISERLFKLQDLGVDHDPKALVCIVGPYENFEYIAYDVTWESYLLYASKFHNLDWVILTNGLQFRVINYSDDKEKHKFFQMEFDEAIQKGNINSFFTFYKILSVINHVSKKSSPAAGVGSTSKGKRDDQDSSDLGSLRLEFWTQLLERANTKTNLFANKKPKISNQIGLSSGTTGVRFHPTANINDTRVQIYIDNGNRDWNKNIFDYLYQHKSEIETALSSELEWLRSENYRASSIEFMINRKPLKNVESWIESQDALIDGTIKLIAVFRPLLQSYSG
jgi:hypothetical protein